MIVFRNTDVDVPFFWEGARQPAARWHADGDGPAQYTSSTPSASWAEFLRHNGFTDPDDLAGIERTMWAIEIPDMEQTGRPALPLATLTGGLASYPACQAEMLRLRSAGSTRLIASSAAVLPDTPSGWVCDPSLVADGQRDEVTVVLFGPRPQHVGWVSAALGRPERELLDRVRGL